MHRSAEQLLDADIKDPFRHDGSEISLDDFLSTEMRVGDLSRKRILKDLGIQSVLELYPTLEESVKSLKVHTESYIVVDVVEQLILPADQDARAADPAPHHDANRPIFYRCALNSSCNNWGRLTIQSGMDLVLASRTDWAWKYHLLENHPNDAVPQHYNQYKRDYDKRKLDYDAWHSSKRPSRAAKRRLGE